MCLHGRRPLAGEVTARREQLVTAVERNGGTEARTLVALVERPAPEHLCACRQYGVDGGSLDALEPLPLSVGTRVEEARDGGVERAIADHGRHHRPQADFAIAVGHREDTIDS